MLACKLVVVTGMFQVMSALIAKAQQALHDDTQPLDKPASAFPPLSATTDTNYTLDVASCSALNISVALAAAAADGAANFADRSLDSDEERIMLAMACYISDPPTLLM